MSNQTRPMAVRDFLSRVLFTAVPRVVLGNTDWNRSGRKVAMKLTRIGACLAFLLVPPFLLSVPHPQITLSPTTLTFAPQVVNPTGLASPAQTITVKNSGNKAGNVGSISVTAPYSQTNNCPSSLAAGGSCTLEVTFTPNTVGSIHGALQVGSLSASLSGTGLAPVGFSPASLDFGTVAIPNTGAAQTVTLTNNQSISLAISSIAASGDYSQANNCPASLAAGATCTLNVSFQPTLKGSITGAITVSSDASLAAQPVGLTGIGSGTATPTVSLSPASLDFGSQEAGTASAVQTVTLKNSSSSTSLTISSIAASGGYATTDTCAGKVIPANGTCTVSVKFQPSANLVPISYPGAVTVVDGDSTSPQVIALSGSGAAPVSASSASLDFGTIFYGATSAPQAVTLTNHDSGAETLSVATSRLFVIGNNTCAGSLAAGGKCTVDVTFGPGAVGSATGVMTAGFSSGGFLNPQVVNLAGCLTELIRTPLSLNFGALAVGKTSSPGTVTIGGGVVNFSGFTLSGPNAAEFAIANNTCGSTLNGGSCTVDLTFTPAAAGTRTASLDIADDQHCSPQPVSLTGGSSAGPFLLTGVVNGTGSGNLTSNPSGLNCGSQGATCSASFATGKAVTVMATPDVNSTLGGWSGACSGTSPCDVTMSADRQVTATFNLNPSLVVNLAGNAAGTGTVTSSPAGINCQIPQGNSACQAYFPPGTSVKLAVTPGSGSSFAGWNQACAGTGACTVTMGSDQSVGATFNGPPTLFVNLSGTGTGTVSSTPAGIHCPTAQCSSTYPSGTTVTLTATPGSGSGFTGWTGPCSGTSTCSINLTSDQNVGGSFDLPDFVVSVSPPTSPTVSPGGLATFTVAIGGIGGFSSAVTLGCTAPTAQGVNCLLSSTSAKPGGSVTLTVTTTGSSGSLVPLPGTPHLGPLYAAWISFPALAAVGIGSARLRSKKRRAGLVLFCSLLLGLLFLQMACGGGSSTKQLGTPAGTYTVNVNAMSGAMMQHSSSVSITVQ
jgi:hypothetical protein